MPAEGVPLRTHDQILRYEEIETVVRAAAELGIHKVRLTGGEPLVRLGIVDLVRTLARIPGMQLDPGTPYTNMVFTGLAPETAPLDARQVAKRLAEHGVRVGVAGERRFRLVTHYWVDDQAVERALAAFAAVL